MLMHSVDFLNFAQSVAAVVLFVSNVLFFKEKHYFGRDNELKPLIHTWSLSIEEQFYIVFPILLILIWRFRKDRLGTFMFFGFVVSLAFSEYSSRLYQSATFYFLHTRAWELLAGAMLARWERSRQGLPVLPGRNLLVVAGLAMIGLAIALFDNTTRHPSLYTLLPVGGTMLIILCGGNSRAAEILLSNKLAVGIGLISYSLYLWHQPLFAFARLYALDEVPPAAYWALIAAAFALSVFSWRYVEMPFRQRRVVPARYVWSAAVSCAGLLFVFGVYGHWTRGIPARFDQSAQKIFVAAESNADLLMTVDGRQCFERPPADACRVGTPGVTPTWALVGDSHAAALSISFDRALKKAGLAGMQYTKGGCLFVPGFDRVNWRYCRDWIKAVQPLLDAPEIETVILSGRYVLQFQGSRFDNGEGGVELGPRAGFERIGHPAQTETQRQADFAAGIRRSIEGLLDKGKRVILVYPIPEVGWNVPDRMFKLYLRGEKAGISTSTARYLERSQGVIAAFDSIADHDNLIRIHPRSIFCDTFVPGRCAAGNEKEVFYFDDDHLSIEGADLVMQQIMQAVQRRWPSSS
jgi:peptidoglycan/LPS O-acetylase OafA/YrhL